MKFTTPLSVATVRGTRLWLTGDQRRTRLDVLEGLVELQRIADGETIPVRAREFAVATPDELAVQPLSWPVDRRDAVVVLETADATSLVRNATTRKFEPIDLQPRGETRLDHNFALVLTGGSYLLQNASAAVLQSCRQTNEFTIEATISPPAARATGSTSSSVKRPIGCFFGCKPPHRHPPAKGRSPMMGGSTFAA